MYGVPFNPLPDNYVADVMDMRGRILNLTAGKTLTAEVRLRRAKNAQELKDNRKLQPKDQALPAPAAKSAVAKTPPTEVATTLPSVPPAPYKVNFSIQVEPPAKPEAFRISGKALDERGQAIRGANIYLINANLGDKEILVGESVTDADGNYEFRDAKLIGTGVREIVPGARSHKNVYFRLAGIAPGRAFAWRGMKSIYLDHNEAERAGLGTTVIARPDPHLKSFAPWEKIELNLTFPRPRPITGRLIDESGKPVAGVTIRLGACFRYDAANPKAYDPEFFCPNPTDWDPPTLVANVIQANTDEDGRFTLFGAPPGMLCRLFIMDRRFAWQTLHVCTADNPPTTTDDGWPVLSQPVALTMRSQRTISITVQRQENGEPLPDARVWANETPSAGGTRSGAIGGCELDKNGQGKLKLPPGVFQLTASLYRNTYAHQQDQELVVADSPAEQSLIIRMQPERTR
jgi:protocatechuate 3,4-dioxygenase beta subunit